MKRFCGKCRRVFDEKCPACLGTGAQVSEETTNWLAAPVSNEYPAPLRVIAFTLWFAILLPLWVLSFLLPKKLRKKLIEGELFQGKGRARKYRRAKRLPPGRKKQGASFSGNVTAAQPIYDPFGVQCVAFHVHIGTSRQHAYFSESKCADLVVTNDEGQRLEIASGDALVFAKEFQEGTTEQVGDWLHAVHPAMAQLGTARVWSSRVSSGDTVRIHGSIEKVTTDGDYRENALQGWRCTSIPVIADDRPPRWPNDM